jgi:hypothetical protein
MAVLRAATSLGRQDPFDLDGRPTPGQTDLMGESGQVHDSTVGQRGELGELSGGEEAPFVEEGTLRGGEDGPVPITKSSKGRGRGQ